MIGCLILLHENVRVLLRLMLATIPAILAHDILLLLVYAIVLQALHCLTDASVEHTAVMSRCKHRLTVTSESCLLLIEIGSMTGLMAFARPCQLWCSLFAPHYRVNVFFLVIK